MNTWIFTVWFAFFQFVSRNFYLAARTKVSDRCIL